LSFINFRYRIGCYETHATFFDHPVKLDKFWLNETSHKEIRPYAVWSSWEVISTPHK